MSQILRAGPAALWTPGQVKPQGPWRIDWTHPLAYGLVVYWIDTGLGFYIDLVGGRITTATSSGGTTAAPKGPTPWGTAFKFTSTKTEQADTLAAFNQNWAAPYSFAQGWVSYGAASASFSPMFFWTDAGATGGFGFSCNATTTLGFYFGQNTIGSYTFSSNIFNVGVGVATGSSASTGYVNGKSQFTGSTSTSITGAGAYHWTFNANDNAYNSGTTPTDCNASIFFGAAWQGRALTATEVRLLYTDPYCFLLPLENDMPLFKSGGIIYTSNAIFNATGIPLFGPTQTRPIRIFNPLASNQIQKTVNPIRNFIATANYRRFNLIQAARTVVSEGITVNNLIQKTVNIPRISQIIATGQKFPLVINKIINSVITTNYRRLVQVTKTAFSESITASNIIQKTVNPIRIFNPLASNQIQKIVNPLRIFNPLVNNQIKKTVNSLRNFVAIASNIIQKTIDPIRNFGLIASNIIQKTVNPIRNFIATATGQKFPNLINKNIIYIVHETYIRGQSIITKTPQQFSVIFNLSLSKITSKFFNTIIGSINKVQKVVNLIRNFGATIGSLISAVKMSGSGTTYNLAYLFNMFFGKLLQTTLIGGGSPPTVLSYTKAFLGPTTPIARSFNGTSDYMTAGVVSTGASTWTMGLWVFVEAFPSGNFSCFINGVPNSNGYGFILNSAGDIAGLLCGVATVGSASLVANRWYHVAITRDGTTATLFVNGVSSGTSTSTPNAPATEIILGSDGGGFFKGNIDDIAVWNTNLSSTQIALLAAGSRANAVGANANLVGYWPITGASPEPDQSGNGNNGTLIGTGVTGGPFALGTGKLALPQHLTGQTQVQNFLYSGAVQPNPRPPFDDISWVYSGAAIDLAFNAGNYYPNPVTNYLSCTRASGGYAKTAEGTLTWFQDNALRITDLGLLVEDARTNYVTKSNDLADAGVWNSVQNITVTDNIGISPDGTLTAATLIPTSSSAQHYIGGGGGAVGTGQATASCYFKADGYNFAAVSIQYGGGAASWTAVINLTNGTIGVTSNGGTSPTNTNQVAETLGNGWYRLSVTMDVVTAAAMTIFACNANSLSNFVGDTVSGIFAWGAQVEAGSFASSLMPTKGGTATRGQDSIISVGALNTIMIGTAWSVVVDAQHDPTTISQASFIQQSFSGYLLFFVAGNNDNKVSTQADGITGFDATLGNSELWSTGAKAAIAFNASGTSLVGGGGTVATGAAIVPISPSATFGNLWGGYLRRLTFWNTRLADATLQTLTTPPSATVPVPAYFNSKATDFLSCSRGSIGYAKTSTGTLTLFGVNILRITDLGLLVEDTRTNLAQRSEAFDTSPWTQSGTTVTPNQAVAPNNMTTMDQIFDGVASSRHIVEFQESIIPTASTNYCFSVFLENVDRRYVEIQATDSSGSWWFFLYVDLQTGTITDSGVGGTPGTGASFVSANIESFANSVYRVSLVYNWGSTVGSGPFHEISLSDRSDHTTGSFFNGNPSYTGSNKSVYAWGAQLEQASFPSSYIPTTSAAVTRALDVVTCVGDLNTVLSALPQSYVMDVQTNEGVFGTYANLIRDPTAWDMYVNGSDVSLHSDISGVGLDKNISPGSFAAGVKIGQSLVTGSRSITGAGLAPATDTNAIAASSGNIYLGQNAGGGYPLNGLVRRLTIWNSKIADATLQTLTASGTTTFPAALSSIDLNFVTNQYDSKTPILNAFSGIPFPQHLGGEDSIQNFIYPGAVQPIIVIPTITTGNNTYVALQKTVEPIRTFPVQDKFNFMQRALNKTTTFIVTVSNKIQKAVIKSALLSKVAILSSMLARSFNGTSDYIDLGTYTWDQTSSATFSHWIYITALPSSYAGLFSTTNYEEYYLRSDGQLAFYLNNSNWGSDNSDPLSGGPTLSVGQWYHLLWTITANGNLNFYLNGALYGSYSVSGGNGPPHNVDAWLGNDVRTPSRYFDGYMSDIALWDTVLTSTQISNLAAGHRANTIGANVNLTGYWPITGASPEPDISGNGNNGTLIGTTIVNGPFTGVSLIKQTLKYFSSLFSGQALIQKQVGVIRNFLTNLTAFATEVKTTSGHAVSAIFNLLLTSQITKQVNAFRTFGTTLNNQIQKAITLVAYVFGATVTEKIQKSVNSTRNAVVTFTNPLVQKAMTLVSYVFRGTITSPTAMKAVALVPYIFNATITSPNVIKAVTLVAYIFNVTTKVTYNKVQSYIRLLTGNVTTAVQYVRQIGTNRTFTATGSSLIQKQVASTRTFIGTITSPVIQKAVTLVAYVFNATATFTYTEGKAYLRILTGTVNAGLQLIKQGQPIRTFGATVTNQIQRTINATRIFKPIATVPLVQKAITLVTYLFNITTTFSFTEGRAFLRIFTSIITFTNPVVQKAVSPTRVFGATITNKIQKTISPIRNFVATASFTTVQGAITLVAYVFHTTTTFTYTAGHAFVRSYNAITSFASRLIKQVQPIRNATATGSATAPKIQRMLTKTWTFIGQASSSMSKQVGAIRTFTTTAIETTIKHVNMSRLAVMHALLSAVAGTGPKIIQQMNIFILTTKFQVSLAKFRTKMLSYIITMSGSRTNFVSKTLQSIISMVFQWFKVHPTPENIERVLDITATPQPQTPSVSVKGRPTFLTIIDENKPDND